MAVVSHTAVDLHDPIGLRFPRRAKKKAAPEISAPPPAALPVNDDAFVRRWRALELWRAAQNAPVALQTIEGVACGGTLLAADAAQEQLVVQQLATPMGTYPAATLRMGDLLSAELRGTWRLSCALPPRPDWLDAKPPVPPRRGQRSASTDGRLGHSG